MRGTPETWAKLPPMRDVVGTILKDLESCVHRATRAGVDRARLVVDPGLGFGKRKEEKRRDPGLAEGIGPLDVPVMVGPSRKSFSAQKGERETEFATAAAVAAAVLGGAHMVRVARCDGHDRRRPGGRRRPARPIRLAGKAYCRFPIGRSNSLKWTRRLRPWPVGQNHSGGIVEPRFQDPPWALVFAAALEEVFQFRRHRMPVLLGHRDALGVEPAPAYFISRWKNDSSPVI